jgi:predicted RNA-binding protein YlqC (UPF0109 family)
MTDSENDVGRLLRRIAGALVDYPESLAIAAEEDRDSLVFVIQAHAADIGKLIGAQGRTARSLRTIMGAVGAKHRKRYAVEIDDGVGS